LNKKMRMFFIVKHHFLNQISIVKMGERGRVERIDRECKREVQRGRERGYE
jgi:hypothetical protein